MDPPCGLASLPVIFGEGESKRMIREFLYRVAFNVARLVVVDHGRTLYGEKERWDALQSLGGEEQRSATLRRARRRGRSARRSSGE